MNNNMKTVNFMEARVDFAINYAIDKGWLKNGDDPTQMSFDQMIEIRSQSGWKNPSPYVEDK